VLRGKTHCAGQCEGMASRATPVSTAIGYYVIIGDIVNYWRYRLPYFRLLIPRWKREMKSRK
jgi:hypothetical protein